MRFVPAADRRPRARGPRLGVRRLGPSGWAQVRHVRGGPGTVRREPDSGKTAGPRHREQGRADLYSFVDQLAHGPPVILADTLSDLIDFTADLQQSDRTGCAGTPGGGAREAGSRSSRSIEASQQVHQRLDHLSDDIGRQVFGITAERAHLSEAGIVSEPLCFRSFRVRRQYISDFFVQPRMWCASSHTAGEMQLLGRAREKFGFISAGDSRELPGESRAGRFHHTQPVDRLLPLGTRACRGHRRRVCDGAPGQLQEWPRARWCVSASGKYGGLRNAGRQPLRGAPRHPRSRRRHHGCAGGIIV